MIIAVSACLLGDNVTWRGNSNYRKEVEELLKNHTIIKVCPEVMGGMSIPRYPSEISSFDPLKVINDHNEDVTKEFSVGARNAYSLVEYVDFAILKARSPSCGNDYIYDGTFSHKIIKGNGVFSNLLKENNIKVFNENQVDEIVEYMKKSCL